MRFRLTNSSTYLVLESSSTFALSAEYPDTLSEVKLSQDNRGTVSLTSDTSRIVEIQLVGVKSLNHRCRSVGMAAFPRCLRKDSCMVSATTSFAARSLSWSAARYIMHPRDHVGTPFEKARLKGVRRAARDAIRDGSTDAGQCPGKG